MADGSKTEKATPKRRQDERKKGHVMMSQDVVSVATLIVSFLALIGVSGMLADGLGKLIIQTLEGIAAPVEEWVPAFKDVASDSLMVLLKASLIPLATVFCAVAATFAQTRMLVSGELIKPKFSKINPLQGFKRLFSLRSLIDTLKNLLKIILLLVLIFMSLKGMFQESSKYLYTDITASSGHIFDVGVSLGMQVILAFGVLAAADYLYQWWEFERQMKMSKQEIKEEYKQMEGDPQIKGKIKETQRRMAQQRMMQSVPDADVVIRNPTHFAVALRYKPHKDNAPVVLAKGQDEVALRIVRVAEEHGIETIENVPLARGLFASTEVNQEIPPEYYGPVAEILVHIVQLDQSMN